MICLAFCCYLGTSVNPYASVGTKWIRPNKTILVSEKRLWKLMRTECREQWSVNTKDVRIFRPNRRGFDSQLFNFCFPFGLQSLFLLPWSQVTEKSAYSCPLVFNSHALCTFCTMQLIKIIKKNLPGLFQPVLDSVCSFLFFSNHK